MKIVRILTAVMLAMACMNLKANNPVKELNLIPQPQEVKVGEGEFKIGEKVTLFSDDAFCAEYLSQRISAASGSKVEVCGDDSGAAITIKLQPSSDIPQEGYKLSVTPDAVAITASTAAGAFYGVQTLLQLMPSAIYGGATGFENWSIPAVEINDFPRYHYRGMMLDVSRTFQSVDVLYKFADWLSYHKINKFHLHLVDDNGWRIEIKKYPALTERGAWRGPDEVIPATFGSGNKRYGGFYTQKQMKEFVKYCAERHIEVIPEFDLPGHSKTIAACFPEILCKTDEEFASVQGETGNVFCVGREENYKIIENIIKELVSIFPSSYIHIGGDEVAKDNWMHCEHCKALMEREGFTSPDQLQNYFIKRMQQIIKKFGRKMAGWDEIIDGGEIDKSNLVYAWRSMKRAYKSVELGFPTVIQVGEYNYIDMKQSPLERGHNWAGIVTLEKTYSLDPGNISDLVVGTQVGLWAELLNKPARFVEYQSFPRVASSAEVGWTNQNLREWNNFWSRMVNGHYSRMYNMGIAFRLPYPDVIYEENTLKVKLPYPAAVVRYTTDGTNPTAESPVYKGDIVTDKPEMFRFATFYNQYSSITVGASNIELYKLLTPAVDVESSLVPLKAAWDFENVKDYDYKTYFRSNRKAQKGDWFTYTFKEAVECSKIIVETGIPNIDFYGVTEGHVDYSYDGNNYIKGEEFANNCAVITPVKAVKAVRIVLDGPNDGHCLCLQDLKVVK